ncbi:(Na+)-NQR maturation NqrM [Aliivibrio sp. S4TY2]|uniref:(Na+)-NQR maturation NqrM n=1 Tax=Aliivibrio finisterrensis TaxID=511998 RepID=A0A4Q5KRV0_9GAMM|nr:MULTISPECIES: (Na+)-NQR maturation NqrM [Aliivibrio]MCP3699757.1 (Na+)-NQR maturation NqrM [Aliivibrio sp.]KAB2825466.1 (Na+)-NQR maturation NqrM [Aliivibrio finisterrensis]MDD9157079.1 (Na+)-NQR maturation NqrM [Aliivibrio sp. S4TY2]MDD9161088.1 (Na+)-NQR maturation NqrM [Aliivibrio sp. S4TY1]MDD9164991.1 (Na+)-NQR maturation NqrM [Aliivibrio sp. S4MY2]
MNTFLITFFVFLAVIGAMAIGYIVQRKVVKGSCGGLGAVGIDKVCNCPEPCDARKKREAKEAIRAEKLAAWEKDRIA